MLVEELTLYLDELEQHYKSISHLKKSKKYEPLLDDYENLYCIASHHVFSLPSSEMNKFKKRLKRLSIY